MPADQLAGSRVRRPVSSIFNQTIMINLLERHNDASHMPIVARNTCMPPAFYDLCASETLLEAQTRRERVATALKLGFGCAALVHQAGYSLTDHDRYVEVHPKISLRRAVWVLAKQGGGTCHTIQPQTVLT